MDKTPFQNEETLPEESDSLETEHSFVVTTKSIDVLSLPQKNCAVDAEAGKEPPTSDELNILDEQWLAISQDWQAQPVKKTDVSALLKQTKRRTQGAKVCFALNIIATLGLIIAFLYGVYDNQLGDPFNTYLGGGALLSIIFLYFETKIRLNTWRQLCDSPEKAIDNAISACQSSVKYMAMTKISFLPFLPLINWFIYEVGQQKDKNVFDGYLMANGFMLAMYVVVEYFHRKRKKQYEQLLKSLSE